MLIEPVMICHFLIFSIAAACWTAHYAKRILETIFVHRFSHNTMPIRNLFKVCSVIFDKSCFHVLLYLFSC